MRYNVNFLNKVMQVIPSSDIPLLSRAISNFPMNSALKNTSNITRVLEDTNVSRSINTITRFDSKTGFSKTGTVHNIAAGVSNFLIGGVTGGITSKLTDGEFKEGFVYGGLLGSVMGSRTIARRPLSKISMAITRKSHVSPYIRNMGSFEQRKIVAGVTGAIFGGSIGSLSNRSKARGLNANRGQRI